MFSTCVYFSYFKLLNCWCVSQLNGFLWITKFRSFLYYSVNTHSTAALPPHCKIKHMPNIYFSKYIYCPYAQWDFSKQTHSRHTPLFVQIVESVTNFLSPIWNGNQLFCTLLRQQIHNNTNFKYNQTQTVFEVSFMFVRFILKVYFNCDYYFI